EIGKTYTLKANVVTTDERQSGQTSVYPYYPNGTRDTVDIKDGKITYTFIAEAESTQFLIYKDVAGQSNVDLNVTIEKAILVEGDKVTGWAPANEDVKKDIQQAEANAKNYTDEYKRSNDVAMTKLETSITQNGDKIALKVDEQKFNASRKTLSQVISEISATTKGINLSYDENGNIQSYTMDRNGIQLRGDKVDITVNKDFNVMASRVDDKVGKNEIINRLNLSPEGLDINMNNIGIRGGDNIDYIDIRNNSILSYGSFTRTWANETDTANLRLGIQGGTVKVQNRTTGYNLYLTEKGLSTMLAGAGDETAGTLEFHSKKYNDTSRGVRLHSTYGAVALESDYSRIILNANLTVNIESNYGIYFRPYRDNRTGNNEFAMYVKQNDSGAYTDGVLKYGNVSSDTSQYGSGIRFSKSSINSTIYATNKDGDIGTGHFFADKLYGDLTAKGSNAYILVDDALRITDKKGYNNGNVKYKDLQCLDVQANSIRVNTAKDFYIGVSTNELRVTNNLFWNGGDTGYKPVRASAFNNASLEQYKTDIKKWDYDALTVIANDLDLYQFKYKNEEGNEKGLNHRGVIIGRDYKTPDEFIYGDGVNIYEMVTWALRSIQQLNEKTNTLEEQLNEQSITS
uniref:tail fiber domain-containing protein n=1 Tax=Staphylococcus haemolyticus TaxID=1283 RepID=UPI0021B51EC0